jgi:hypothetical protein
VYTVYGTIESIATQAQEKTGVEGEVAPVTFTITVNLNPPHSGSLTVVDIPEAAAGGLAAGPCRVIISD